MKIIFPTSRCPICHELLGDGPFFATWGTFVPREHPLFRFIDAAMHWSCYYQWESRDEFARLYAQSCVEMEAVNVYWHRVAETQTTFVSFGEKVNEVDVLWKPLGISTRIPLDEYEHWLQEDPAGASLPESETTAKRLAWARARAELRAALPSVEAIREGVRRQQDRTRAKHVYFEEHWNK